MKPLFIKDRNKAKQAKATKQKNVIRRLEKEAKGHREDKALLTRKIQALVVDDILTVQGETTTYRGNAYRDYGTTVQAISSKYIGTADWGVLQTGTIINLRAAFIIGEGLVIKPKGENKEEAENEIKWVNDFLEFNKLDSANIQQLTKEAEIEGKIAFKMSFDKKPYKEYPGMTMARYISWTTKGYTVKTDPNDYLDYQKLTWMAAGKTKTETLTEKEFVYRKFAGRLNKPNEAMPRTGWCLTQIDNLDKALRDWREINHIFAAPTPVFKYETAKDAKAAMDAMKDKNWRVGKAIFISGEFLMVSPGMAGIESILKEIEMLAKFISGTTGIPVYFLGLIDLLKSKATGSSVREVMSEATSQERGAWIEATEELIRKSMVMYNETVYKNKGDSNKLDPDKITVDIPRITQEHWDRIEKVLIPAATHGIISNEYVASQIPGVDRDEEASRKAENDKIEFAKMQEETKKWREEERLRNLENE